MIGYKKSLISLATALALSSSAFAATSNYVPLATDANDYEWKLFGVDGLFGGGTSSFSTGAAWDATLIDSTIDEVASSGITVSGNDMMQLKGLTGTGADVTSVTLNVDTTDLVWSDTDPMRTMFIAAIDTTTIANVMVSYKASMEGQTIQIQTDGDTTTTHQFTLNGENTYDNPQATVVKSSGGGSSILSDISDAVDFDFSDNPKNSNLYETTLHQTAGSNAATALRMYDYNASDSSWSIYDTQNDAASNDFTAMVEGKAYWGRMNVDGTGPGNVNTQASSAGVVLGSGGLSTLESTDYAGLTQGWNLISFDSTKPSIRTASTGMIIQITAGGGDDSIRLADSTGANFVDVAITGVELTDALAINRAVEQAQERGEFSDTFDLRAIPISATQLALISNKKFTLIDTLADGDILYATTLADQDVWDITAMATADYSGGQIPLGGVSSVTGEYMLVVEPLLGANTAAELDFDAEAGNGAGGALGSAAVQVNDNTANLVYLTGAGIATDDTTIGAGTTDAVAGFITALQAESTAGIGNAINLDVGYDGIDDNDWILLASDEEFYVRDHTFTRVITQHEETALATGETLTFTGATSNSIITTNAAVATTLANFEAAAETSGVYPHLTSDANGEHFTLVSAGLNTNVFNIYDDDGVEIIEDKLNLTSDVTKGAIKAVASVDALAAKSVVTNLLYWDPIPATHLDTVAADGDVLTVTINGVAGVTDLAVAADYTFGGLPLGTDAQDYYILFEKIVTEVQARAVAGGLDVAVSHDCLADGSNVATAFVTIEGYGITSLDLDLVDVGAADYTLAAVEQNNGVINTEVAGTIIPTGDLELNLKYNAVYTPNYAIDGPLYTMKTLGWTAKALITGSTDMSTGDIAWNSIDLTKTPQELFDNQDFDLFSIDGRAGYWTYLDANLDTNELNVTITGTNNHTYIHHFNADGTTENHVSANINVLVDGLPTDTSTAVVYANAGGTKINLTSSADDGEYSGDLTSYEVDGIRTAPGVTVTVSDGLGWKTSAITVKTIDVTKPDSPNVNPSGANGLTITPVSADTSSMYVFSGNIPESVLASDSAVQAHANFIARMDANASALSFCANQAIVFGSTVNLKIAAIDGQGYFGLGNVSDIADFDFAPATKGSVVLTHLGDGTDAKELGIPYDGNCSAGAVETIDHGVSVKSVTSGTTAKVAFEEVTNAGFNLDVPLTIYIEDDRANVAEVKFVSAYIGATGYILFDDAGVTRMYEFTFPATDAVYGNSDDAADLTTDGVNLGSAIVTGQSF